MAPATYDERAYFQRRLREEIARCRRYHDVFSLVTIQDVPSAGRTPSRRTTAIASRLLERRLRTSDVVGPVFEDVIAVLLVGTGANALRDAEQRIRAALAGIGGTWKLRTYAFPDHAGEIEHLDLILAA